MGQYYAGEGSEIDAALPSSTYWCLNQFVNIVKEDVALFCHREMQQLEQFEQSLLLKCNTISGISDVIYRQHCPIKRELGGQYSEQNTNTTNIYF